MRKLVLILALPTLVACGSTGAPAGPPPSLVTPTMLQPPPIYALIGHRDRLELSSQQIEGLDSIAVGLRASNDSLVDELQERAVPSRNQMGIVVDEEGRPILEQIRDNNRGAAEAVGRLLTQTQQTEACDLFQLQGSSRSRNTRARVRGADPSAADSIWRALESRTWPWCGQSADEDEGA